MTLQFAFHEPSNHYPTRAGPNGEPSVQCGKEGQSACEGTGCKEDSYVVDSQEDAECGDYLASVYVQPGAIYQYSTVRLIRQAAQLPPEKHSLTHSLDYTDEERGRDLVRRVLPLNRQQRPRARLGVRRLLLFVRQDDNDGQHDGLRPDVRW